jgi:hypothetical protein
MKAANILCIVLSGIVAFTFNFTNVMASEDSVITSYDQNYNIVCIKDYTYPDAPQGSKKFNLCYTHYSVSKVSDTMYHEKFKYTFYKNKTKASKIKTIEVGHTEYYDSDGYITTTKGYVKEPNVAKCRWYDYCGDGKYSADCTNLKYGRKVHCEPVSPVYFPYNLHYEEKYVPPPTKAPIWWY